MNLYPYASEDLAHFTIAGKTWRQWCEEREEIGVSARENVWISAGDINALMTAGGSACLKIGEEIVATTGADNGCGGEVVEASQDSFLINYVWDLLRVNEQVLKGLVNDQISGEVHPQAVIEGTVIIGVGTRIVTLEAIQQSETTAISGNQ